MKKNCRMLSLFVFAMMLVACAAPVVLPTEIPTELPVSTETGLPISTPTPESSITPSAVPTEGWSGVLKVRKPDDQEINLDSVWVTNLIDVKDVYVPGTESYSGEVDNGNEYAFPAYWCAKKPEILFENLNAVSTQLIVNGEIVPDQYIFTYNYADDTSWHCNYRSVILSGWEPTIKYTLEIRRTLTGKVFDGKFSYEPGVYIAKLVLTVR